ncbi:PDZ domain-containing protein [Deefgea piscis]|uniref:PDZ domain-containing protein n=1 Tax=Deefgea piscis TaxID=2739061 RepID=UPI001C7FA8B7|nr:PDZ domain-containing protein [Deefgea piscis]QZA81466.1 PDZ domain-containing protein [Deefgea piscis]
MKYKLLIVPICVAILTGCMTFQDAMVASDGKTFNCESTGGGIGLGAIIGVAAAAASKGICVNSYEKLGYIKATEASTVGLKLEEKEGKVFIKELGDGGELEKVGVKEGDQLLSVNQDSISTIDGAKKSFFGKKGSIVKVVLLRGDEALELMVQRNQSVKF